MYRSQRSYRSYNNSRSTFSRLEKIIAGVAALLFVVGVSGYIIDERRSPKREQPLIAGTYIEGVVADSPTKVDRIIASLTNVGLTYRETDGAIKPALAASWEVLNDSKTYKFTLRDGFDAEGLLATIKSNKTNWEGIEITAPTPTTLQFNLPEPFAFFLSTTTRPLFPYGPYEVVKRDKKEIILRSNPNFVLGNPYIPKVVIKPYETVDQLNKATKNNEITGSADFTDTPSETFVAHELALPRYYVLFLNMTKPAFKKTEDRARIMKDATGPGVNYVLLANQTEEAQKLAASIIERLKAKQVNVSLVTKTSMVLQKEDIPKRQFDLLLYGVDYGIEPDYYPFWHSSQVNPPGLNISGVKDKELDKLLEAVRKEQDPVQRTILNKAIETYLDTNSLQQVVSQEKTRYWVDKSIKGVEYAKIDEGNERFSLLWRWYTKSKLVRTK